MHRWVCAWVLLAGCPGGSDGSDGTDGTDGTDETDVVALEPCAGPIAVDLSSVELPTSGSSQTVSGVVLSFDDHEGGFAADLDTFQCLWLHPAQMRVELGCMANSATLPEASGFGPAGSAAFVALRDGSEVARFESTGANPEDYVVGSLDGFDTVVLTAADGIFCSFEAQ